jgi:NADH dehydrogenase FAD-containing subunit
MKVVVLGGGYAGAACATRLAHRAALRQQAVQITLVNPVDAFIERIRLHQAAVGQWLRPRPLTPLLARAGVQLRLGSATAIDLPAQTVQVGTDRLAWDRLVLALGSHAGRFDVPGAREHASSLDAAYVSTLLARLQALPAGAPVTVVGAGLTGVEAASEIAESFPRLHVQLLSRGPLLAGWSVAAQDHVRAALRRLGVALDEGVTVTAVAADYLSTSRGERAHALCVWTAGFELPPLASASDLAVTPDGRVRVDAQLRSISHPRVYIAGDLAVPAPTSAIAWPMGCKSALPLGAQAAENLASELAGQALEPFDFALPFFCVSLGRSDGLIQWPDAQDRLHGEVMTGAPAARFKEAVCSATWRWLEVEASGREAIRWRRTAQQIARTVASF